VRRRVRQIARKHPRWGWRTAHAILREGHTINRKRTRRPWRDEGLRRPPACKRKRTRPPGGGLLLRAERPNQVWAIDFQLDETADRRRLKPCNMVDEHTREALAMDVGRTCTADDVVAIIERLVAERGAPQHLHMDKRTRADRLGAARLVPHALDHDQLHRAWRPVGEPLRRELQRPRPR
jgi:putative transposase